MSKNKGFIKGTIIGAAVGAAAALLLAPKSGKETQEDLKRRARLAKQDLDKMLEDLAVDLSGRIEDVKSAAKDLHGEAKLESKDLVRRAEVLKQDLRISATNLASAGSKAKDTAVDDAKRLLDEGQGVMTELERVTKKLVSSAKDKMKKNSQADDED